MDRLTALKVFITVNECGSLTAAAEQLALSRAMISRYLAELERWMGVRLMHRTTRRLSLTSTGEAVLQRAKAMQAMQDEMEQIAVHPGDSPKGLLRLTSSYSFAEDFLMRQVDDYLSLQPNVAIDVLVLDRAVNLVEERIDLAIRITNALDPNVIARKLGTCRSVVCASPEYLKRCGTPRTIADLATKNCLTYSYFGKSLWQFDSINGPESVPVSGNLSTNISSLLLQSTLRGAGISLQPHYSVQKYLQNGELIALFPDYEPSQLGIYALYATRKLMSPVLRSFLDFLVSKMQAEPIWQAS